MKHPTPSSSTTLDFITEKAGRHSARRRFVTAALALSALAVLKASLLIPPKPIFVDATGHGWSWPAWRPQ